MVFDRFCIEIGNMDLCSGFALSQIQQIAVGGLSILLRYTTPGVQIGAAISIAALLLFLFSMWIRYKIRGKYGEKMHQHRRTDVQ